MTYFFIKRPIFAWVIAILIMLVGVIALINLPIEQYPRIAPPQVSISAVYPGADAKTVENSVTQVIEQQLTGIDGLSSIESTSSANSANITLSFDNHVNPDTAQVQVQNKLQAASSALPEIVQRQGVQVSKTSGSFLMVAAFASDNHSMDELDIADYVNAQVVDEISRVDGVGGVNVFGSSYAMRIWLKPEKLRAYALMPSDVAAAVSAQNAQVSAGQLAALPSDEARQLLNATVTVQSYLQTPQEFQDILLKSSEDGAHVYLKDVADVQIGAEQYGTRTMYNGKPAAGMAIMLASGANALHTKTAVEQRLNALKQSFPNGLDYYIPYDTTPFVVLSIKQVVKTLIEAVVLVFLVMFLFLQNFRATIIATLAIPVVILGTFAILSVLGLSINILTLFALVLAIGLLVDDAIVVVENVERILFEDRNISVVDAVRQSMQEISKVVIGIALILSAVFVPMVFFSGGAGVIYRQFAITLITSMSLSALVALIFTPALCATILKRHVHTPLETQKGFFGAFNRFFVRSSQKYERFVEKSIKKRTLYFVIYSAIIAITTLFFIKIPTAFVPNEDQGAIFTIVQMPQGTTINKTNAVMDAVNDYFHTQEGDYVNDIFTVSGFSFMGAGQDSGMAFVNLKHWDERKDKAAHPSQIAARAMALNGIIKGANMIISIAPPPIQGFDNTDGFSFQLQDTGGVGYDVLINARNALMGAAMQDALIDNIRPDGKQDASVMQIDINHTQAATYGLNIADVNNTIATAWGGRYVGDFLDRGRIKKVYMQGIASARTTPEDLQKWYVRGQNGQMVGFATIAKQHWSFAPPTLKRYNGFSSVALQGAGIQGSSAGEVMQAIEAHAANLPDGISLEWTGLSLQTKQSSGQAFLLYGLSVLVVFLCLAALYESWSIPFAVMLVVPLGVIGALLFTWMKDLANDVYLQVGLLTVVGLSAKNAILIIEFAKQLQDSGQTLSSAIKTAARQRLRPIIMTSLAFGVGVIPLFFATGAGSGSQNAVGTSVLGGVISATVLGVFFIPMFYVWIRQLFVAKNASS